MRSGMTIEESAKKIVQMFRDSYEGHEFDDAYNTLVVEVALRFQRDDMKKMASKHMEELHPGIGVTAGVVLAKEIMDLK